MNELFGGSMVVWFVDFCVGCGDGTAMVVTNEGTFYVDRRFPMSENSTYGAIYSMYPAFDGAYILNDSNTRKNFREDLTMALRLYNGRWRDAVGILLIDLGAGDGKVDVISEKPNDGEF